MGVEARRPDLRPEKAYRKQAQDIKGRVGVALDLTVFSLAVSFGLGMSCVLMPCCLPALTGFTTQTLRLAKNPSRRSTLAFAAIFSVGVLVPFTLVGVVFAMLGNVVSQLFKPVTYLLGGLLILFGLLHIAGREFSVPVRIAPSNSAGVTGFFQRGMVYGLGAADCAIMILAPIFFLSLTISSFWTNLSNFIMFGVGRSFPILLSSVLMPDARSRMVGYMTRKAVPLRLITGFLIASGGALLFLAQF